MRPIVNVPEEDRATDIGNMHNTFGKHRTCGSGDILTDIQTDRRTQLDTSGYATWFTAGGAIRIAHYDAIDDVITGKL